MKRQNAKNSLSRKRRLTASYWGRINFRFSIYLFKRVVLKYFNKIETDIMETSFLEKKFGIPKREFIALEKAFPDIFYMHHDNSIIQLNWWENENSE